MHRIECVPCGNRAFSNREALQQHLKTSSAYHPYCEKCDKRFSSESGLEAHMAAKHPPTFDCARCTRSYRHLFALEDHYRGSPYHPNCSRCGKGFRDELELEEHRQTAHVQRPCTPCGGELVYQDQDSLDRHYINSERHTKCAECNRGFRDDAALRTHTDTEHSPTTPSPPMSPAMEPAVAVAPSPTRPEVPAKDGLQSSPTANGNHIYQTEFFSPKPNFFKDLAPSGSRRLDSPDLSRLSLSFAGAGSPLLAVQPPPFSPAGLIPPGREANELWNSKMNVQIPSPLGGTRDVLPFRTSPVLSRNRFSLSSETESNSGSVNGTNRQLAYASTSRFGFRPNLPRPASSLPSLAAYESRSKGNLPGSEALLPRRDAIENHHSAPQYTSPPRMVALAASLSSNSKTSLNFAPPPTPRDILPRRPSPPLGFVTPRANLRSTVISPPSRSPNGLPITPAAVTLDRQNSWSQRSGSQINSEAYALALRNLLSDADDDNAPLLEDFDSETPKVAGSPKNMDRKELLSVHDGRMSGSEGPLSSPSSVSFSGSEETSLTSALNESITLEVLEKTDLHSPWPESKLPLPESQPDSPETEDTPLVAESVETCDTSLSDSLGSSPTTTFYAPGPLVDASILDREAQDGKVGSSCLVASSQYEDDDPCISSDLTPVEPKLLPPLHCRACKVDSCSDITATMCGHIFCNSCIVDAVIKTSKCPFCSSPTLLYCLFKLHL